MLRLRTGQHLRRQGDFRRVRTQGRRIDGGAFVAWWYRPPGEAGPTRVGVVASTAAVGGAVKRNAAKRRLRELFRHHQALVPPGSDVLLVARASLTRLAYQEVENRFVTACRRMAASPHD